MGEAAMTRWLLDLPLRCLRPVLAPIRRAARDYELANGPGSARRDSFHFAAIVPLLIACAVLFAAASGRL